MDYDYFWSEKLFSDDECALIRSVVEENIDPNISDAAANGVKKTSNVKLFRYGPVRPLLERMRQFVLHINSTAFGFDLFEVNDFDVLMYNTYSSDKQGEYGWHKDGASRERFDHKLTVLLNLSKDSYSGGEFELFLNGGPVEIESFKTTGSVIIFPCWTVHRVKPVTQGTRLSLSQFYSGPLLK